MKRRWISVGCVLLSTLLLVSLVGFSWGVSGTRFKIGEAITFEVRDSTTWWWGCCSCSETRVLGWRIANNAGQTLHSVVLPGPGVPASTWQGSWDQFDANGLAVAAGQYKLLVDTSAGTLSRCFSIYDPCGCVSCYSPCSSCACEELSSITDCSCKVSLVFVDNCQVGCFPLFWWGGCCGSSTSTGCGCP